MSKTYSHLSAQKDHFINLIETSNFERDQAKANYESLLSQYTTLKQQNASLSKTLSSLKSEISQARDLKSTYEKQLQDAKATILSLEKKNTSSLTKASRLTTENEFLQSQLSSFQTTYTELEKRKTLENETLAESLENLRKEYSELKRYKTENELKIKELSFTITSLTQEVELLKLNRDKLSKTIDDNDLLVKSATAKEQSLDMTIKSYEKQLQELKFENEKLNVKVTTQQEQIESNQNEFHMKYNAQQEEFDMKLNDLTTKYEDMLQEKIDEINVNKSEYIAMKIERDKYYMEYKILQSEIDKMSSTFREESQKTLQQYKENEQKTIRIQSRFQDKIKLITEQNEKLEKENVMLVEKVKCLEEEDKKRKELYGRLTRNDSETHNEIAKIKKKAEELEKENLNLKKQINKLQIKYNDLEEICFIGVGTRSNNNNYMDSKKLYSEIEEKAMKLLDEQNGITNEMEKEYMGFIKKGKGIDEGKNEENKKEIQVQQDNEDDDDEY